MEPLIKKKEEFNSQFSRLHIRIFSLLKETKVSLIGVKIDPSGPGGPESLYSARPRGPAK